MWRTTTRTVSKIGRYEAESIWPHSMSPSGGMAVVCIDDVTALSGKNSNFKFRKYKINPLGSHLSKLNASNVPSTLYGKWY